MLLNVNWLLKKGPTLEKKGLAFITFMMLNKQEINENMKLHDINDYLEVLKMCLLGW